MKGHQKCYTASVVLTIVLLLGCLAGIITVSVFASPRPGEHSDRDRYSVSDTRIISIDLTLSSGITLKVYHDASAVNATLFALSTPPKLDGINELKHTLDYQPNDDYQSAFFYLYPGSNVTISACSSCIKRKFSVYVIKGSKNFTLWQDGKRGISVVDNEFQFTAKCESDPIVPRTMTMTEADDWYFATDHTDPMVNLTLQRYEYTVKNNYSILSSCIAGGNRPESCTLAVVDRATYLLKIGSGPSKSVVEANVRRALEDSLVAVLIILLSTVLLVLCCIWIICCGCCMKGSKREGDREPLVPPGEQA